MNNNIDVAAETAAVDLAAVVSVAEQTDADGTWTVRTFASGVVERQLHTPSPAFLRARDAQRVAAGVPSVAVERNA